MKKILSVLLAMMMLTSVFAFSVSADASTIVVTQATMDASGVITVVGKYTSGTPGAVTILATAQNEEKDSAALNSTTDATITYVDNKTAAADGSFTFKFKPRAVAGTYTTIYVCTGGAQANLFTGNFAENEVKVNYDGTTKSYTSVDGVVAISLRPATKNETNIATLDGYFKQWDIMGLKANTEGKDKPYEINNLKAGIITATPEFYADPTHTDLSMAKAQKATLKDGKLAIRFLALVGENYGSYTNAGFVVSTLGTNPTIEAGYKANVFNNLYEKVAAAGQTFDIADEAIKTLFNVEFNPAGILYANLIIEDTDAAKNTTYYATPYLEGPSGRVYGATKAISYAQLATNDAQ